MPYSDNEPSLIGDGSLAVVAEALYLGNLMLLPGIAFGILLYLYVHHRQDAAPLARSHLEQTLAASLWGGGLLLSVNLLIFLLGGYQGAHIWVMAISCFIVCHTALVILGAYGLAKAMAGQCWRYPLVGKILPSCCRTGPK